MKILIPTDFSSHSEYAIGMAKSIAQHTDVQISLFHSIENMEVFSDKNVDENQIDILQNALDSWANEKINAVKQSFTGDNIKCEAIIREGKFIDSVAAEITSNGYDLMIIGFQGESENQRTFLGSNTQKVLREFDIDILVMNAPFENFNFQEAVFISGLGVNDHNAFLKFLRFIDVFDIKEIHVITIDTASYFSQPTLVMVEALKDFKTLASEKNIFTHFYKDYSIESGVRHFQEEFNIDIIGISNVKRHPIKRFLFGSTVELIANRTSVPLLSINTKSKS